MGKLEGKTAFVAGGGSIIRLYEHVTALVSVTVAATAGVADSEQGLASGLLNTAQQIGSAVGLAILVAVATARTQAIVASTGNSPAALQTATTGGFQAALAVGAGFAALGVIVALLVIREQKSPRLG